MAGGPHRPASSLAVQTQAGHHLPPVMTCLLLSLLLSLSLLSASTSVLPPLLLSASAAPSSSAYEYTYDPHDGSSFHDSEEQSDRTGRQADSPPHTACTSESPPSAAPSPVCRYCSLCSCRQPSLQDGLRFSAWIRRYLYTPLTLKRENKIKKKNKSSKTSRRRKQKQRKLKLE